MSVEVWKTLLYFFKFTSASGSLYWSNSFPGTLFSGIFPYQSDIGWNVRSSEKTSLTILFKLSLPVLSHSSLCHYPFNFSIELTFCLFICYFIVLPIRMTAWQQTSILLYHGSQVPRIVPCIYKALNKSFLTNVYKIFLISLSCRREIN